MGWIVSILGGLWTIISKPANLLWGLLIRFWPLLLAIGVTVVAIWPQMKAGFSYLAANASLLTAQIDGAGASLTSITAAGWPSWLADGFAYINTTLPIAELMLMLGSLIALKIAMTVWRVLKSLLPFITG